MLESSLHGDSTFVTLTYDEEHLPHDNSLNPRELSLFLKRVRRGGNKIRYFGVGEYGDLSGRPHYHVILFGFPTCDWIITRKRDFCCNKCEAIKSYWGLGQVMLGTAEQRSFHYVAGYVNKKMTSRGDKRLDGRHPEFARMSNRPGLGYNVMHEVASELLEYGLEKRLIDVPIALRHGKVHYPLGRYLRRSLRKMIGRSVNAPQEAIELQAERVRDVREGAFQASIPFKRALVESTYGKRLQIKARYQRQQKVKTL